MPPLSITLKRKQQVNQLENVWNSFLDQQRQEVNSTTTDTHLNCDDGCIPVHSPILAEVSDIFKELFLSQGTDYLKFRTVILAGFKVAEIKLMIQFIYAGFIVGSLDDAETLKDLLCYFQIKPAGVSVESTEDPDTRSIQYYVDNWQGEIADGVIDTVIEGEGMTDSTAPKEECMTLTKESDVAFATESRSGSSSEDVSSDEDVPLETLRNKNVAGPVTSKRRPGPTKINVSSTPNPKTILTIAQLKMKKIAQVDSTPNPKTNLTIAQLKKIAQVDTNGNEDGRIPETSTKTKKNKKDESKNGREVVDQKGNSSRVEKLTQEKNPGTTDDKSTPCATRRSTRQIRAASQDSGNSEMEEEEEEKVDDDEEYVPSPSPPPRTLRARKPNAQVSQVIYDDDSEDDESEQSDSAKSNKKAKMMPKLGGSAFSARSGSAGKSRVARKSTGTPPTPRSGGRPPGSSNPSSMSSNIYEEEDTDNMPMRDDDETTGRKQGRLNKKSIVAGRIDGGGVVRKPAAEELYEEDVDKEFYQDSDRIYELSLKCFVCKKTFRTPMDASRCVTENHGMVRCYMCFSVAKTTEGLFEHYKRKHQNTARKETLQCPFYNCQQPLTFRSLSTHILSQHLPKGKDESSSSQSKGTPGRRASSSSSAPKRQKLQMGTDASKASPKQGELLITKVTTGGQQVTTKLNY